MIDTAHLDHHHRSTAEAILSHPVGSIESDSEDLTEAETVALARRT